MKNKRLQFVALVTILCTLYGVIYYLISLKDPTPLINENVTLSSNQLFSKTFSDKNGQVTAIDQWRGKILIVNFWATWCGPCREEMPDLDALYQDYKDQDVIVLGIAEDDVAKIHEFTQKLSIAYPIVSASPDTMELSHTLGNDKGVLPYTVIIDRDGKIVTSFTGRLNRALIEPALISLLSASKTTTTSKKN